MAHDASGSCIFRLQLTFSTSKIKRWTSVVEFVGLPLTTFVWINQPKHGPQGFRLPRVLSILLLTKNFWSGTGNLYVNLSCGRPFSKAFFFFLKICIKLSSLWKVSSLLKQTAHFDRQQWYTQHSDWHCYTVSTAAPRQHMLLISESGRLSQCLVNLFVCFIA